MRNLNYHSKLIFVCIVFSIISIISINPYPGYCRQDSSIVKDSLFIITDSSSLNSDSVYSYEDSSVINDDNSFSIAQSYIRKMADSLATVYSEQFKEKQLYSQQLILLSDLQKELLKADDYIKRGIDTASFNKNLNKIESEFGLASEGIDSIDAFMTLRNFTTSALLMKELIIQLDKKKEQVGSYLSKLEVFRKAADSLQTNPILFAFAKDSSLFSKYFGKLLQVSIETSPVDSNLTNAITAMNDFESRIDNLKREIVDTEQKIILKRNTLWGNLENQESPFIFSPEENSTSLSNILSLSYMKDTFILKYYTFNNTLWLIFLAGSFLILAFLNLKLKNYFKTREINELSKESKLIIQFPILSALFIALMLFEFLFPNPPVIFQGLIWTTAALLLTIVLWNYLAKHQLKYWLILYVSFILTLLSDLILGITFLDRLILLIIAVTGIAAGIFALKNNIFIARFVRFKKIILSISILILTISVLTNIFGLYNFSKLLVTISFFMLISAYLLFWTMILGLEFLKIFSIVFSSRGNDNIKNKISRFETRSHVALRIVVIIGWLILLVRNFHIYDNIIEMLSQFLESERTIGEFTFTFEKVLIFFFIIFLSTVISKIIAFFADLTDSTTIQKSGQKSGLSNWMLLIRIGVLTIGVLIAFAATGIPIDRITIIIGSLGIGIGLGLQAIVNNLVSGIILAFEKPFRLGDKIEVNDNTGRIKEIGIRSSKIFTSDGAVVIIPNGDMLSKVVTNWTLKDPNVRTELKLNFKFGTRLNEVKEILQNILDTNQDIHKNPEPLVLLDSFENGSSEYLLRYWTDIDKSHQIKSEVMLQIETALKKANIGEDSDK